MEIELETLHNPTIILHFTRRLLEI